MTSAKAQNESEGYPYDMFSAMKSAIREHGIDFSTLFRHIEARMAAQYDEDGSEPHQEPQDRHWWNNGASH